MKMFYVSVLILSAMIFTACEKKANEMSVNLPTNANSENKKTNTTTETQVIEDGFVPSESGTEKEKPESGKANVQGKALFNEKAAAEVEVKLCETFNQFSGCSGQQYKTKTDAGGEYIFKGVEPKTYDALLVKVFNTNNNIFASSKFGISAAKYKIEADKTFFAPDTNLFKSDLKVQNPKPKATIDAKNFEMKWDAYPDAAYYEFGMYAKDASVTAPYVNEKTEATAFKAEKPITDGEYNFKLEAFNANNVKLAETEFIAFKVSGGETAPAANK